MSPRDPILDDLARLRGRSAPHVDVAGRVMDRVALLPRPARPRRRTGLALAAGVALALTAIAAGSPVIGPLRVAAAEALPALIVILRGLFVAAAASAGALVRVAGGPDAARALVQAAGIAALAIALTSSLLLLAREIRRAPALVRSSR